MKHFIYLLLLLPLVLCLKCKSSTTDDPDPQPITNQLPPETTEGKNTFGCLVNGEVWKPYGGPVFGSGNLNVSYYNGGLLISALNFRTEINESIAFNLYSFYAPGKYLLSTVEVDNSRGKFSRFNSQFDCYYTTNEENKGILEVTHFDSVNFIISGRFEFTVAKEGCDTIRVTDGRFDIKYAY